MDQIPKLNTPECNLLHFYTTQYNKKIIEARQRNISQPYNT